MAHLAYQYANNTKIYTSSSLTFYTLRGGGDQPDRLVRRNLARHYIFVVVVVVVVVVAGAKTTRSGYVDCGLVLAILSISVKIARAREETSNYNPRERLANALGLARAPADVTSWLLAVGWLD